MLLHLSPRYYARYTDVVVDLIDVSVPELNLVLKGGEDVVIRTPFPNKCYLVVCRKKGRKAINGFFVETDAVVENFTLITRWAVNGDISTHRVHFHITDADHDTVTDSLTLWNAVYNTPWQSRKTPWQESWTPASAQPRMITLPGDNRSERDEQIYNVTDAEGFVRERVEYFSVPTVERERLTTSFLGNDRLPATEDAFSASVAPYAYTLKPTGHDYWGTEAAPVDFCKTLPVDFWIDGSNDLDEPTACPRTQSLLKILTEIREKSPYAFTNTNDLLNKAQLFSPIYAAVDTDTREFIDNELTALIFSIEFVVERNEATSGTCPEPLDGECGCAGAPNIRYHQGKDVYVCLDCHKRTEPLTRVDFDDFLPMEDE
ncbi:hypothetical protein CWM94_00025 [Klebsiella pneumoniae]|nr:hypothetical protein CWM94_00025 [Klebsiella pneumoniae]